MKIIVICGGNSSEKEISVKSGMSVFSSVKKKYKSEIMLLSNDYSVIKNTYKDGDIVFNALHGGYGESGEIQSFFEKEGIDFIGSGSKACEIAMDKSRCKKIAQKLGISTPFGKIFSGDRSIYDEFCNPFIIKPNNEGSSVGFNIVGNHRQMLKALKINDGRSVMFEEFIKGREITVSILGSKTLPIVEIIPNNGIYDYDSKYIKGKASYVVPAKINSSVESQIKKQSIELFNEIECKHYSRIDYILSDENTPYFLEINTSPGMTETSLFPKSAASEGLDFDSLIEKIISLK
tara:strand:+ start:337 stop:1212 length:876 start_codon:yes stop_codon:yes gene_type:complete